MKCDQDLCLNFWYDFKKLLWQDELNPRVRCAFGNVWYLDDHYLAKAQNVPEIAKQDDWGKEPEKAWE